MPVIQLMKNKCVTTLSKQRHLTKTLRISEIKSPNATSSVCVHHYINVPLIPDTFQPCKWSSLRKNFHQIKKCTRADALNYLLTHSMEQSPSWEANWFSASQEIPRILWNPKVHYRIHKCPPPGRILSQIDPVHSNHIPLPQDSFNIPYTWVSQVVSFPQVSPPKPCTRFSSTPYVLHVPSISFFSISLPE